MAETPEYSFVKLPLNKLVVSDSNVRKRDSIADVDELAQNMRLYGLQQPIVVQPMGDRFEILIGQRRFLAAKDLGWTEIDARVRTHPLSDFDARVVSFSENVQRRDLAPRDKADVCQMMLDKLGSPAAVAKQLGVTEPTVRKWLGFAAVPEELKVMVEAKQLSVPTAMRLFQSVADNEKAVAIATRMIEMKAPKSHQKRIIAETEEAPGRPINTIFRRAEEARHEKRIYIILPDKWALAMDRASERLQTDASDIARDAVIEWLEVRRY